MLKDNLLRSALVSGLIWKGGISALAQAPPVNPPPRALSGGATTQFNDGREAFALILRNAERETRRKFVVGNSFFNDNWVIAPSSTAARDGLGPLFHTRSCSGCHTKDGRGAPPQEGELMTSLLLRLSIPGEDEHGGPKPDPIYGGQLGVQAVPGAQPEAEVEVRWEVIPGTFPDGEAYELRKPQFILKNWRYGQPAKDLLVGPRLPQVVFGGGLLEAVADADVQALADPNDKNGDGISGRTNLVWDKERQSKAMGRFGWKANQASLRSQTADAFLGDIGITSSVNPNGDFTSAQEATLGKIPNGGQPEISQHIFDRVVTYLRALAPPARREWDDPEVQHGEALFSQLQCAVCHSPTLLTKESPELKELNNQVIHPFTDLLLHDLGGGLADHRPDYLATGNEWRTPPLWGLGLNLQVNGNVFFLHDGRARTPQEAILWHDGEAAKAREAFKSLPAKDRLALIRFLESL